VEQVHILVQLGLTDAQRRSQLSSALRIHIGPDAVLALGERV
jgi:hypothetical protein